MTETRHGFAPINGASVYYETAGAGPALVMLHGHLLDHRQWDDQFAAFAPTHRVVRYDARGFGQSSLPPAPFRHADDLYALLQFLGVEHAVLMGCSGGGGISLDFALLHPAMVDGLILVGSSLGGFQPSGPIPPKLMAFAMAQRSGDVAQMVELSVQVFTDGDRQPEQVNPTARQRARTMSAALFARRPVPEAAAQDLEPPASEWLGEIQAPALAIVGANDNPMIHDIARLFVARMPHARLEVMADAAHHPNLDHPDEFNALVTAFLRQLP